MNSPRTATEIEYPERDGRPMGETDLHRDWMVRILEWLRYRYREQSVYVSSDLLIYYEQGNPRKFVVPDVFVVKDCDPGRRRMFRVWEEPHVPHVAFEVTSASTRREDITTKPRKYQELGISEYFLYDPTGDYLVPPLRGYRLQGGRYAALEPDDRGTLHCQQLSIDLWLEDRQLCMADSRSGTRLQSEAEAERTLRAAAEAEVRRLQALLKKRT